MGADIGRLRIRLLGDPEVRAGSVLVEAFASARLMSLLGFWSYIGMWRRLAFLFWPDSTESQARTNLRQALHNLRHALGDADRFVRVEGQTVQWRADAPADIDLVVFERLADTPDGPDRQAAFTEAVEWYGGDLLVGVYDEWIDAERERLRRRYVAVLHELISLAEKRADAAAALAWGGLLLRADPLDEGAYRRVIGLYLEAGDRARAVHVYHACVSTFDRELGVAPGRELRELHARIVADAGADTTPTTGLDGPRPVTVGSLLIGRDAEWDRLVECRGATTAGGARLVVVQGEPGIGKSYLANAFRSWCARQGAVGITSAAYEAEGNVPYAPVVDLLRSDAVMSAIEQMDGVWLAELARLLPELRVEHPVLVTGADEGAGAKRRLFEAAARALTAAGPSLVWVLDDLQWCDADTIEFVHFLVRFASRGATSLLVVGTARSEEIDAGHALRRTVASLRAIDAVVDLELGALTSAAATQLATELLGPGGADPARLERLVAAAEGNPLFLVEMARGGDITQPDAELPMRMRSVIEHRLTRLPDVARDIGAIAAVFGRMFGVDAVIAASEQLAPDHHLDVVAGIDELWRRGILREHGDATYDFSHGKLREVAYQLIAPAWRRQLHAAAAAALEIVFAERPELVAAQAASHYDQAGDHRRAIAAYQRAVALAHRAFAYDEIITLARRGLDLLATRAEGPGRDDDELGFLEPLGVALHAGSGQHRHDASIYERAIAIRARQGRPPDPTTLRVSANLGITVRDFPLARRNGERLLERGTHERDRLLQTEGHYLIGVSSFWLGKFGRSFEHLSLALDSYRPADTSRHLDLFGQDPKAVCLVRSAFTALHLGQFDTTGDLIDQALAYSVALNHPYTSGYVRSFAASHAIDEGEPQRAKELITSIAGVTSNVWLALMTRIVCAWCAPGADRRDRDQRLRGGRRVRLRRDRAWPGRAAALDGPARTARSVERATVATVRGQRCLRRRGCDRDDVRPWCSWIGERLERRPARCRSNAGGTLGRSRGCGRVVHVERISRGRNAARRSGARCRLAAVVRT